MQTILISALLLTYFLTILLLFRWGNAKCIGSHPVSLLTFFAILFTSGMDVGLIMMPLTEYPKYQNISANPAYAFANPLAIEFGFWSFAVWLIYFVPCFYFCIIEPKIGFFKRRKVKFIYNILILAVCAFSCNLLIKNLPWYLPQLTEWNTIFPIFYVIAFFAICMAVFSSTSLAYIKYFSFLGLASFSFLVALFFFGLTLSDVDIITYFDSFFLITEYFKNIDHFMLPINDYHQFYLFWWFSWSLMVGQFTARFVGGLRAWQLLTLMLVVPSIPIAFWFTILYMVHSNNLCSSAWYSVPMAIVGILFVTNSIDSLIRLYTESLNLTVAKLGKLRYVVLNITLMFFLTLLFSLDFLKIQWLGLLNILLFFLCFIHCLLPGTKMVALTNDLATGNNATGSKSTS